MARCPGNARGFLSSPTRVLKITLSSHHRRGKEGGFQPQPQEKEWQLPRKKRESPEKAKEPDWKVSLLVPKSLYDQAKTICSRRGVTLSILIRELLRDNVSQWLEEGTLDPDAPRSLTLRLDGLLFRALGVACAYWGLDLPTFVQLVLNENVSGYLERGKRRQEEMLTALRE